MAVPVADSISLMFFRWRPQMTWWIDSSSWATSTYRPSYTRVNNRLPGVAMGSHHTRRSIWISTWAFACSAAITSP